MFRSLCEWHILRKEVEYENLAVMKLRLGDR